MRPTLLDPVGALNAQTVMDALSLADCYVQLSFLLPWTPLELSLAYDYAMREHLAAAGNRTERRPKPHLVELAERERARGFTCHECSAGVGHPCLSLAGTEVPDHRSRRTFV